MINFSNTYEFLPEDFFQKVMPDNFSKPHLIKFNESLANQIGISMEDTTEEEIAQIFSGQKILPGSTPLAMAYAGFQFGHPVHQLGDGRAHLLGEVNGHDIQLKGSGLTNFSRRGDGRSALGPVLREYIVSEAMHALGVPTTRALCAVTTGEQVLRQDGPEPGGIFTRVASSHLRVGTFQYFAFRNDIDSIKTLLDYTLKRHYPTLLHLTNNKEKVIELLKVLINRQSELIAKWSAVGFIHGVMNTDNFSMAGITIDYGPCAFMDEYKFEKVFSSVDRNGRYSFFNQVPIAKWNILRLAECLLPLVSENQDEAIKTIENEIVGLFDEFEKKRMNHFGKKLGITDYQSSDDSLIMSFLTYLEKENLDFTLAFRNLPGLFNGQSSYYQESQHLNNFQLKWKERVKSIDQLDSINPIYIPRNHLIQKVIEQAYENNFTPFHKLIDVLRNPYTANSKYENYALGPKPGERVYQTFCGT